jgi:nucleotide-binding universal stress UspA family protein
VAFPLLARLAALRKESEERNMKVLIAIDDSKYWQAALACVANLFSVPNTTIRVLHVLPELTITNPKQVIRAYTSALENSQSEGRALADRNTRQLQAHGFSADSLVIEGDVVDSILNSAAAWKADLILLGCRARSAIGGLLSGRVSHSVLRHAKCPVLLVPVSYK